MKPHTHTDMTLERLRDFADAYGADPRRWPEGERDAAVALMNRSVAARDIVAEAGALDAILDGSPAHVPDAALARLTAATAFPPLRPSSSPVWASVMDWRGFLAAALWPRATVFAGMIALGIVTGLALEPVAVGNDAYAMVVGDLFSDMDEDLGL